MTTAATDQHIRDDVVFLQSLASTMSYNDTTAATKHRLNEIAMRMGTGYYTRTSSQLEQVRNTLELMSRISSRSSNGVYELKRLANELYSSILTDNQNDSSQS